MKYDFTHFTDELSKIKCTLNNSQLEQFELYYDMLIEKNKVMNLTAITDFDEVIEKHFLDSLFLCHTLDLNAEKNIIDVGLLIIKHSLLRMENKGAFLKVRSC